MNNATTLTLKEIFDKSKEQWGLNSQLLMMAEESSELSVASLHMTRTVKTNTEKKRIETLKQFAEEIADVQFMIDEMVHYFTNESVGDMTFFDCLVSARKRKQAYVENLLK